MKTALLALIGMFCFINLGFSDADAKTLYRNLKPLVDQAFKDANLLLEEIGALDARKRESVQDVVNLARGAALEAQLLISTALKDIRSGKDGDALALLNQIPSQLDRVSAHSKNVRDQIKPKLKSKK